jgi:hypothetical protein
MIKVKISKTGVAHDNNQKRPFAIKNKTVKKTARMSNGPKNPNGLLPPPNLYSLYAAISFVYI